MLILQWNINGIYSHFGELKTLIAKYDPEIIALQETHLRPNHKIKIQNYEIFRYDYLGGEIACGGTAILVKNNIVSSPSNLSIGNLQAIAVKIDTPNLSLKTFSICSIYIPPHQIISVDEISDIFKQLTNSYIVVGDFNAHSYSWGSKFSNNRGNIIDKFLTKNSSFLLNNGSHTHFNLSNDSTSAIDLSFCLPNIAHLLE